MSGPLRVLLVEDSPTDAKLVLHALRCVFDPVHAERVQDAPSMRTALESGSWDAIICDWSMPQFNAPAALALVREMRIDLPFIIVSGTVGEETAVEAMRAGAQDYVLKDKLTRLAAVVDRELRECQGRAARREAEAALRESEARFRRLSDSGIVGIVVADVDGNILEANDAYLNMVGYSREELIHGSVRWAELTPPEFAHLAARAVAQLQATGVAPAFEMESLRQDGSRIPVLVGAAMLDFPRCITFIADLTARKHAEAGRVSAEEALVKSEEQLRHAQKMEAVGRLAGGVAHDFNNLLSVIMSYAGLLIEALVPGDPMRDDLEEIKKAGERATDLTRQLLAFSRRQPLQPRVVDLSTVLASMASMLPRLLGEDIEIKLNAHPDPRLNVKADPGQIEQVVMNLAVNARDAMPKGGTLTIAIEPVEFDEAYARQHVNVTPGPHVMLSVSDTGIGMDNATLGHLFEPFFTTKEMGKGTGLGLSTVYGIVRQSGGTISVQSEPGRGTTFKIYFPHTKQVAKTHVSASPPATQLRGTETILLVEDEEQVRNLLRGILTRNGYQVLDASNGGEALLHSEKHPGKIQLLLTDVVMPKMNGRELADRIAATRPEMRVLFMSGYTGNVIIHHGVVDEGVTLLEKPITPELLLRTVRGVLTKPG